MLEESIFKKWIQNNRLDFSHHAYITMKKREISVGEIYFALKNTDMKIIQIHPPKTFHMQGKMLNQHPVYVILGHNMNNFYFHMVIAKTNKGYKLITVYKLSKNVFNDDFKTLKSDKQKG